MRAALAGGLLAGLATGLLADWREDFAPGFLELATFPLMPPGSLTGFAAARPAGARSIGAKLVDNTMSNAAAVFDAAEAIARAKTLPEATRLQAEFFQKQLAAAGAQTKELFELSTRVAQQTLQTVNEAAGKTMEKVRKSS